MVYSFQDIISNDLQAAYKLTTSGKFANATTSFKAILHSVLLTVVSKKSEVDEVGASSYYANRICNAVPGNNFKRNFVDII